MWVDRDSKITIETAKFLGVPFAMYEGAVFMWRYKRTEDGVQLQYRYFNGKGKWRPEDLLTSQDLERSSGKFCLVRRGKRPIKRINRHRNQDLYVVEGLDEKDQP